MSYTTNITEEITIRNTSAKAAHIAAQIHHYLQELDSMSYIGRFLIVHAALDADGNHVEVRDQWKDIDGLYRREFDEFGKETRVYWREDIVPSAYHGLMNLAASLRRSSPFKEPVKDITFRIDYFCECSLATIGIEFWKEVFEAMDCEELRQQVRYSCVQDYDSEERTAFAYRYDEKGFHEVTHQPGFDAIADTGKWGFDLYTYALNEDRDEGTREQQEIDEEIVATINAYTEKYNLSFDPEKLDEITIEGYYECDASAIPELLDDVECIMCFLSEKGYIPTLVLPHAVCRDISKLAAIRFGFDDEYQILNVESVRL